MQKLCCVRTRQQFYASLDYFVTSSPPYLHQFSTISGGNCIRLTVSSFDSQANQLNQSSIQRELLMPSPEVIDLTLSDDETQPDPIRSDQGTSMPAQATNRFRTSSSTPPTSGIDRTRRILPVIQGTFAAIERAENYLPLQPFFNNSHFGQTLINCIHNQHRIGIPDEYFVETCINTYTQNGFVTKEFVKIDEDSKTQDYTIIYIRFQGQTPPFSTFKDHEGDAQLILQLLHEHHTGNSQYSRAEINRITKYLTSIKLDDTWRGTNESFLMHYNDQLRLLDSLVDSDEKLPDNTRVPFLESAVESVPDLRRVKITDNVLQAQLDSTRPISYRSYFDLLKDAAFHLDQATKRGNKIRHTNVHFSGPNDEDEHQNLSSDDNQVIHQEDVYSEPPEPLSYSLFLSHFQGSSTSNTQKIFLPKPIWEKLSKDQQQMIIDHNRSLPKSGSSHLSTPNKSRSSTPL